MIYNKATSTLILVNFGFSQQLKDEKQYIYDQKGSPAYVSPEVVTRKPYLGKPTDMWALGVCLYKMLFGQYPFYDKGQPLFGEKNDSSYVVSLANLKSIYTIELLRGLLTYSPKQRITIDGAIELIFKIFHDIRDPRSKNLQISLQVNPEKKTLDILPPSIKQQLKREIKFRDTTGKKFRTSESKNSVLKKTEDDRIVNALEKKRFKSILKPKFVSGAPDAVTKISETSCSSKVPDSLDLPNSSEALYLSEESYSSEASSSSDDCQIVPEC